jgi:hypothetical protein
MLKQPHYHMYLMVSIFGAGNYMFQPATLLSSYFAGLHIGYSVHYLISWPLYYRPVESQ